MKTTTARRSSRGFSMTEMVTTVSVIGVLGTIAVIGMGKSYEGVQDGLAMRKVEELNRAVHEYNQASTQSAYHEPMPASTVDELRVLLALRSRASDVSRAKIGAPFVQPIYNPRESSNSSEYRITWVGTQWSLLRPGTAGTGLRVVFDNSDMDGSNVPPDDINPLGR